MRRCPGSRDSSSSPSEREADYYCWMWGKCVSNIYKKKENTLGAAYRSTWWPLAAPRCPLRMSWIIRRGFCSSSAFAFVFRYCVNTGNWTAGLCSSFVVFSSSSSHCTLWLPPPLAIRADWVRLFVATDKIHRALRICSPLLLCWHCLAPSFSLVNGHPHHSLIVH